LEQFWLESVQAFVAIEAFAFEFALPICERNVRQPLMMSYNLTPHVLLWLGLARLGVGDLEGASEALDRMNAAVGFGGVGFEYRCPLLQAQAACALARRNYDTAKSLAARSIALASEHRVPGSAAQGQRLLSEIAIQEGDHSAAVDRISAAMTALDGCHILNVEWQVHATAARALALAGRTAESERARAHGLEVGRRVAATLSGEPALRESLLLRIEGQLSSRASA